MPVIAVPKADLLWKGDAIPSLAHFTAFEVPGGERMSDRKYNGTEGMVPAFDLDPKKKPGEPEIYVNRFRAGVDGATVASGRSPPPKWTIAPAPSGCRSTSRR